MLRVRARGGSFVTQRQDPRMALVRVTLLPSKKVLCASIVRRASRCSSRTLSVSIYVYNNFLGGGGVTHTMARRKEHGFTRERTQAHTNTQVQAREEPPRPPRLPPSLSLPLSFSLSPSLSLSPPPSFLSPLAPYLALSLSLSLSGDRRYRR
jgi:hypothetical protein